ncbi:WXG100 family type VII secretion target [Kitasatospora sp. NPDC058162]|uniref:WXG100 family type VII secretion target n=1 Tax=Kitasatospora sp. NPDC058162 TaxID=3346362 RepID=UPI0036DB5D17
MADEYNDMKHAELKALVDRTTPDVLLKRAGKLQDAGRVLTELSTALQAHLGTVTWEGQAGENFKTWVGNLYKSAAIIGEHSTTAGGAMTQAGEALSTAKVAMPQIPQQAMDKVAAYEKQTIPPDVQAKVSAVGGTADEYMKAKLKDAWVSDGEYKAFKATIQTEQQEAAKQVGNLAQAYSAATTTLNGIPADVTLPGTPDAERNKGGESEYTGGGGYGSGSRGALRSPRTNGGSAGGSYSPSGGSYGGATMRPRDPATSWQDPSNPTHPGPVPPYDRGQLPPPPQDPGTPTPPSHPSDPVTRPGTGLDSIPTLPDQTTPVGPGSGPVLPSGPSGTPTYPGGPGGPGSLPGLPGSGPIAGFPGGTGGGSVPTRGIGSIPGKGGGSVPLRTGPFSGGSVPGKAGTPGLPNGAVFGREGAIGGGRVGGTTPGGGMGGMHPGMGGGHGVGGGGVGGSRGRGLTSTPGGTVGGRKGPAAGGEFTPGGTGLRIRAAAAGAAEGGARSGQNGMMAPGAGGHGNRKERDRRNRADYLHEDEETWTSGTPDSNPDVIE